MKKQLVVFIFITLMSTYGIIAINAENQNLQDLSSPALSQTYRPVFEGADENTTELVIRDNSVSKGAVLKTDVYNNVTIWYSYVGGDNESAPLLFGDDGTSNAESLSWLDGTLMNYDAEATLSQGGGVSAWYNYTFNLSSQFIVFRARYGEYEDDLNIPNIITNGVWLKSDFTSEYYTQFDDIELNITLYNYNITGYGLMYREVTPDHTGTFQNVTYYTTATGTEENVTASFNPNFDEGTEIEVRAFIIQYDNITNEQRILHENRAHFTTLIEGSPTIELDSVDFTNELNVSIYWNAEAPNLNITAVDIDWNDSSGIESLANISKHRVYHVFPSEGTYEINVTVFAGPAYSSSFTTILIDQTPPTGKIQLKYKNGTYVELSNEVSSLETTVKEATFRITGTDIGGSGVSKLVVETDEGNSIEGYSEEDITLQFIEYGLHEITLRIFDIAGNEYEEKVVINLIQTELPGDFPVPFPFGITTILPLIALAIAYLRKKK